MPWDLTGNSGTNPANNFLGTADNQPLAIRTNNTERVRVTPAGDVGIGTTTPGSKLEVRGPLRTTQLFFVDPNGIPYPDNWIGMAQNIEGTTKWLHIGGITEGGVRRLTVWADRTYFQGNVGIGTTQPGVKLHIEGGGDEPFVLRNNNYYFFAGANRGGGDYVDIGAFHTTQGWKSLVLNRGAGNVGIGTATPGYRLTVNGVVQSLSGGFRFPDGSVQTAATLRGPAGPQGPQGPPGPAVSTSAVCAAAATCDCFGGRLISRVFGPCAVTSDTGPCSHNGAQGSCCVCAPG